VGRQTRSDLNQEKAWLTGGLTWTPMFNIHPAVFCCLAYFLLNGMGRVKLCRWKTRCVPGAFSAGVFSAFDE
jgi:hypothetical protein